MKKRLFLIGAGGLGREIYSWIKIEKNLLQDYDEISFIDDEKSSLKVYGEYPEIVGNLDYKFNKNSDFAILCIADTHAKVNIVNKLQDKVNFTSFISEKAIIAPNVEIKNGVVVSPNCIVSCNAKIEEYVFINLATQIGHDSIVGKYSSLMASVVVGGNVNIGSNCYFGSSSTIMPRINICENTVIGMSAAVIKSIKVSGRTYFGNPAKKI